MRLTWRFTQPAPPVVVPWGGQRSRTERTPALTTARTTARVSRLLAVILVIGLLGAGAAWFVQSRGFTAQDLWEVVDPPPPEPCDRPDPTGSSDERACVTATAQRLHDDVLARFGEPGPGAPIRSATCWSEHAWNPSSDHPAGRACDYFPARAGDFPAGEDLAAGWAVAQHVRDNASELGVRYVIWQGRIWTRGSGDVDGGWGRPYSGGGVYDPDDATGGHYDHVHVSVRR